MLDVLGEGLACDTRDVVRLFEFVRAAEVDDPSSALPIGPQRLFLAEAPAAGAVLARLFDDPAAAAAGLAGPLDGEEALTRADAAGAAAGRAADGLRALSPPLPLQASQATVPGTRTVVCLPLKASWRLMVRL